MQSFWEFKNVRIPIKFAIALALLCAGLIFMSASYYQTIVLQEKAQARSQDLNDFLLLVSRIQANVSEARYQEKSFQAEKEMDQLTMYNDIMETVDTDILSLKAYLRTDEDKALVEQFQAIIDQYQDTFYDASEASMEIGLSKEAGLSQEIRTLIWQTEPLVVWLERSWIREELNTLSTNIDEFVTGDGQTVTAEQVQANIVRLKNQIEATNLRSATQRSTSSNRETAVSNMNRVDELFVQLADSVERKYTQYTQLQTIIAQLAPKIDEVTELAAAYKVQNDNLQLDDMKEMATYFFISMGLMITALAVSMSIVKYGVIDPLRNIQNAIDRVRNGEVDARSELDSKDELGQLSNVLDSMLEEKENALQLKEAENKRLNSSIISLIQNVFQISQRDLTVRVPVAEDVTGAISDSVNQLVESIESVLLEVNVVSGRVNTASAQVKSQSETVLSYAEREKEEISETLDGLDSAIKAMELISKLAAISNNASQNIGNCDGFRIADN